MLPTPYQWTEEVEASIIKAIRGGAFPLVAAEACRVPREAFLERLQQGANENAPAEMRKFHDTVREAIAFARLRAETYALTTDPLYWLKYGPGKETAETPGWSNAVKSPFDGSSNPTTGMPVSPEALVNFIPELANLPAAARESMLTALNGAKKPSGGRG
jgi:hypothetical protein